MYYSIFAMLYKGEKESVLVPFSLVAADHFNTVTTCNGAVYHLHFTS